MSNGTGEEILDNKVRRMIFNHISEYPGVSYIKLKNIFELSDSSLRYHLHYLEKHQQVSSSPENGVRCYFPHPSYVSIPEPQEPRTTYQLTPNQHRILNTIIRYPGINQKELTQRTGLNRFKVSRNVSALKDMNLIKNNRYQNIVCYEYNPNVETKYKIMKGLMIKFLKGEINEATFIKMKRRLDRE
jgi:predicted transcriptional regulator